MSLADLKDIRKVCIKLSVSLNGSYQHFAEMGLFDLIDLCVDYKELTDEERRKQEKEVRRHR